MTKKIYSKLIILLLFWGAPDSLLSNTSHDITGLQKELTSLPAGIQTVDIFNDLGEKLIIENYELAKDYNDQALLIAEETNNPAGIGEAKRNLGIVALQTGSIDHALQLLEESMLIAQQNQLKPLEARILWSLGYYWGKRVNRTANLDYVLKAEKLFTELQDDYWLTICAIELGWAYHHADDQETAERYFEQAISQSKKNGYKKLLTEALYGISGFYLNLNLKPHLVHKYLGQGLQIAQENNQLRNAAQIQMALGSFFRMLNQRKKAKLYYLEALEYFKSVKLYPNLSWLYQELGDITTEEKEYTTALGYYNAALNITDKSPSPEDLADIYMSLGLVYKNRDKDYKKALEFYYKALEITGGDGSSYLVKKLKLYIGYAYLSLEQFDNAAKWCEQGMFKSEISLNLSVLGCDCLSQAYNNLGETQKTLTYYKKLNILKDSLHKEKLSIQVNNLEAREQYEREIAEIKQNQAIEKEQSKTRTAWIIGGISLLFMSVIMGLVIANIKRTEQKNQLIALAKLRKELIANVSHDLRTPIAVMRGYVETLLMKINSTSSKDREKYLNIILNSTEKLSILIGQLFEFSKLESQQIQPQKEPFQINELLSSSLEEYQVLANRKGVQLAMDCPENTPVVYADISLIERVIQNLMDNALKFTPEKGKIQVYVTGDDQKVEVSITDTGSGITEEQQTVIFDRHEKDKNSNGAGLGLAIVKKIVELHEGVISVKSELGKGTQFIFSLPTNVS